MKELSQLENILAIVRSINEDEFQEQLTTGNTLDDLSKEISHLSSYLIDQKNRKAKIIEHITDCCAGNFFHQLPISNMMDELDVISMGFNTYIEELEAKIVSRDYFFQVLNAIPLKIIVLDNEGKIDFINEQSKEFFVFNDELKNYTSEEIFSEELLKQIDDFIISKNVNRNFEIIMNETDQMSLYLSCSLLRITLVKKNQILLVAKDITEQRNEAFRILKATLYGQEIERKRLAYDLHDSLGQELNAIKMYLSAIDFMKYNSVSYLKSMKDVNEMLANSITSIQDICFDLMPVNLENNSLNSSISQLINRLNSIKKIIIYTTPKIGIKLKEKKDELFVYRIVQEFLNNSIKYSHAQEIEVKISENINLGVMTVYLKDNGIGFDMDKVEKKNGINNINQRLKTLNTIYNYTSELGKGTELKFTIYEKNTKNIDR